MTWVATHTPGPWEINEGAGMAIAKVSCFAVTAPCTPKSGSGLSLEENEANAKLIAAAPDLREALQDLLALVTLIQERTPIYESDGQIFRAEQALEKAGGWVST